MNTEEIRAIVAEAKAKGWIWLEHYTRPSTTSRPSPSRKHYLRSYYPKRAAKMRKLGLTYRATPLKLKNKKRDDLLEYKHNPKLYHKMHMRIWRAERNKR